MAYNKEEIYQEVIEAIKKNKLNHFDYIQGYVKPCTKTLYEFFPEESNELHSIKRELQNNKIEAKSKMISKWLESDNATLQIAAFKLLATDEERKNLSSTFIDHTSNNKELKGFTIKWGDKEIEV